MKLAKITDIGRLFVIKQFNIAKITSAIMIRSAACNFIGLSGSFVLLLPSAVLQMLVIKMETTRSHCDDSHPLCASIRSEGTFSVSQRYHTYRMSTLCRVCQVIVPRHELAGGDVLLFITNN